MRKVLALALVLLFAVSMLPLSSAYAQGKSGVSTKALSQASDDSAIDKIGDWFATRGKSDAEKQKLLAQRKAERAAARAQKMAEKKKRQMQKEAEKAQKKMKEKMKGMRD